MSTDPSPAQESLQLGVRHHQAGRLREAETIYRQVLASHPEHADAHHLLGVVALQVGQNEAAVAHISKAIELEPGRAPYFVNLGTARQQQGAIGEAIEALERAIELAPGHADAHFNLGNAYQQGGQAERAIGAYQRSLEIDPSRALAHNNLGNAFADRGEHARARRCYERALECAPDYAEAYYNLGNSQHAEGDLAAAIASYRKCLALAPTAADGHVNLGNALLQNGDPAAARACYERAVELEPGFLEALSNLGALCRGEGDLDAAIRAFERAREIDPHAAHVHLGLGNALLDSAREEEGVASLREAHALEPESPDISIALGSALELRGSLGEAQACFREALDLHPGHAALSVALAGTLLDGGRVREACEGYSAVLAREPDHYQAFSNHLLALNYRDDLTAAEIAAPHRAWEGRFGAPEERRERPRNTPDPPRSLRVGYVSPDFRQHPVAHFIEPVLSAHDRAEVELFCYSDAVREDAVTQRLQSLPLTWRPSARLGDDELCSLISADAIDVLVDLCGHTGKNRLRVFSRAPAPVQMSYLGYPNTTGVAAIGYRLTDATADPSDEHDDLYVETRLRLPECFCCYAPPPQAPSPSPLPAGESGSLTFASLNQLPKVSARALSAWARILERSPGARLVLQAWGLADRATAERLRRAFAGAGGDPARLELLPHASLAEHLAIYRRVDIALDPFPWNGHTTTCHALWMGVPVVALRGGRFAGRTAASVLRAIGAADLVAESEAQYVDLALALAADRASLARRRAALREQMRASVLLDRDRFTRSLEAVYRSAWRRWCDGPPPRPPPR